MMARKFFKYYDKFPAPPLLRVKTEPEQTNLFGGICSIFIIGLFLYIFINTVISMVLLEKITATEATTVLIALIAVQR